MEMVLSRVRSHPLWEAFLPVGKHLAQPKLMPASVHHQCHRGLRLPLQGGKEMAYRAHAHCSRGKEPEVQGGLRGPPHCPRVSLSNLGP